jgi:hypothetical protein
MTARTPAVVMSYGLLGLVPFLAPPVIPVVAPTLAGFASQVLALYGALILSFLGGARWGLAVTDPAPSVRIVSLAMLPTLIGLGLLLVPIGKVRLLGLAAALGVHWVWDIRCAGVPGWYPGLRTILTAGAIAGLLAGAFSLT